MSVAIERLGADTSATLRDEIVLVYERAWTGMPFPFAPTQARDFSKSFERHVLRRDFRLRVARDDGAPIGFAYGYTSRRGVGWWRDAIETAMASELAARWLENCFEFVELAVVPEARGRGVGGRLHDALLEELPHSTAILSTQQANDVALALYRERGWEIVLEGFRFAHRHDPYVIMGLDVPAFLGRAGSESA
ncbi:MAG TPA: GNAT family N-acetyltransferase [Actinomycetota bacterium]|nr:GNAT family N-acetyltransferase [Actinomycetota bacterium]